MPHLVPADTGADHHENQASDGSGDGGSRTPPASTVTATDDPKRRGPQNRAALSQFHSLLGHH